MLVPDRLLSLSDRVVLRLQEAGLGLPERPAGKIPDLPTDLTNVSSRDVGRLLAEFSAWLAYITPQAALARVEVKSAKIGVQAAKKLKHPDDEVSDLERTTIEAEAWADVLDALERSTLRKKEAVSREITRLVGEAAPNLNPVNLSRSNQNGPRR